ncbi:hypothetical protein ACSOV8_16610 [Bacillus halotolerans]|uniref:hypothetical protein n=1 Tax=Bacillus halotolerans TaxID=260554 RepID=UPI00403FB979
MNLSDSIGLAIMTIILTFITNIVFKLIQNSTDFLVDKKKFRREHNFAQLKNLYLDLYGVVSQSEYLRYYSKRYRNIGYEFRAYPFFEIIERVNGEEIKNGITEFNKQQICETIIKKSQYASQELLKLAVAYRYVNHNYLKDHSKKRR